MCVCVSGGRGGGRGAGGWRIGRTHIELLRTFSNSNKLWGRGINQGFWHLLKFEIKYPKRKLDHDKYCFCDMLEIC